MQPGVASGVEIVSGLWEGQVWQRNDRNVSDARIEGRCPGVSGAVWVRVVRGRQVLRGWNARPVGHCRRGRFNVRVTGLPVGGPYAVTIGVGSGRGPTLTVGEIRVGDVWILAGQSNMQGSGRRIGALAPHPEVRAFYMDDRWAVACDPLHNLWNAVDPVHGGRPDGRDDGGKGVGPGLSFGQSMFARTGIPQGLIACAHGGTSMPQWDPMHKDLGGLSLYGAMCRRVHKNGGRVAGVIWYQGESDAMQHQVEVYAERMHQWIAAVRREFRSPRLPMVMVQLARYAGENQVAADWNAIQDIQRRLPERIRHLATVPAIDLLLDDGVHVAGLSHQELGRRMAEAMDAMIRPGRGAVPPIAFKQVRLVIPPNENQATIEVTYDHVVGGLIAPGRPIGFTIMADGKPVPAIYDIRLSGSKVLLKTSRSILDFVGRSLHYGAGLDPACTITDTAGRPLPVMGPIALCGNRTASRFPTSVRVSGLLPGTGTLKSVVYPKDWTGLKLTSRPVEYNFVNLHPDFSRAQTDVWAWVVTHVVCDEPMRVAVLFGYDGPVKLWIDGRLRWHDPAGKNPAVPDGHSIPVALSRGRHEVAVALGSNGGLAWGLYLRFERLDRPRRADVDPHDPRRVPRFEDA